MNFWRISSRVGTRMRERGGFRPRIEPGGQGRAHHLTAPESKPLMMYFWKNKAKTTGGITASTPAAMMVT